MSQRGVKLIDILRSPIDLACMQNLEPCDAVQFVDVRFSSALVRAAVGRFGRCRYRGGSVTSDRRTSRFFEVWLLSASAGFSEFFELSEFFEVH